jgi:hypothetical protein
MTSSAATVTWDGSQSSAWETGLNWDNTTGPIQGDVATINSGTVVFSTGTQPALNALRLLGGTLTFSGGTFNCANSASVDSHVNGTLNHTGTVATINELEIGRTVSTTGIYTLSGGTLDISRGINGYSLYLGANKSAVGAGSGTLEISGGTFKTRSGVKLGDATLAGTGKFTVLGSVVSEVSIATLAGDQDGTWVQHSGSTLKVGIDIAGVRKIFIKDSATASTGTSATFASGSLLDVGYYNGGWGAGSGGGTWTVMEVENGDIIDNGLAFAAGVNTSVWSFSIDNTGANGLLKVTASGTVPTGNVFWDGSTNSAWDTATNWSADIAPVSTDYAYINYGTPTFSTGTNVNFRGLRLRGGTLTISGGAFSATALASAESHVDAELVQTAGTVNINELEIGRTAGKTGTSTVSGGDFIVSRGLSGYSIYIGANRTTNAGTGSFQISGGSLVTRSGVRLGDPTRLGTGKFTVLGSAASQIGIAASNTDTDGTWQQNAGSTLKVGIDFGGLTKILIKDSATATTGTSATFASGSLLDVGYHSTGYGGGTWTVMEVENGDIINNGLAFAPGVNTAVWSFSIDNSGANGLLKVTAVGAQAGIDLTVGNTLQQKMRYGLDYERLWYWYGSTANKNTVARWSMVDCDVDYIRVAMNCEYELTEGSYDLTAYTDKIIPMMQAMKAAKPNIKFFASPRPLNEAPAPYNNARWQPYPYFITGDPGDGSSFNFNWQKCAEYLVRYVNLMKTYGFKISFMDMTNEWNFVTPTHIRDIKAYMVASLLPADMPLIIAPSAWSYDEGDSWLTGVNTTAKKAAIDIAGCHNTDKTGTAQEFADKAATILPGKEVWSTELHGWKGDLLNEEIPTSSFMWETIRAGFSGINGWLAIGTPAQGHCYILNNGTTVERNVKFFIFQKLSTTSNYGNALDINQPTELTSTTALIRGNLMTVWVLNNNANTVPIRITPTGRTLSQSTVKRTRWNDTLAMEGVSDFIPATTNTSAWSSIAGNSLYCFEVLLEPIGAAYSITQAEAFNGQSGTTTETCTDTGGGQNVTNISNNDWLRFDNLNLGLANTIRLRVARAAGSPESRIEVRQGSLTGTVLGSIAVPETGGSQTWETIEASLTPTTGTQSLFLKFIENGSSTGTTLAKVNWLSIVRPTSPTSIASTPISTTQATLTWAAVAGATSYEVSRATAIGGPYTTIASSLTTNSFNNTGLTGGTRYYYTIRAVFNGVTSTDSTPISTIPSSPITAANTTISSVSTPSNNNSFRLSIHTAGLGQLYQVQASNTLTGNDWTNESTVIMGTGAQLQFDLPITPGVPKRFYRVNLWRE